MKTTINAGALQSYPIYLYLFLIILSTCLCLYIFYFVHSIYIPYNIFISEFIFFKPFIAQHHITKLCNSMIWSIDVLFVCFFFSFISSFCILFFSFSLNRFYRKKTQLYFCFTRCCNERKILLPIAYFTVKKKSVNWGIRFKEIYLKKILRKR